MNRELDLLKKLFNLAIRDGLTTYNPCRQVQKYREDNQLTRYLSSDEEPLLLAQFTGRRAHLRPVVVLAIHIGMRRRELLSLAWPQVDFQRRLIWLGRTKNGKDRFIPMNEVVISELLALRACSNSEFVFPSTKKPGTPMVDIKRAFRAACKSDGIPKLRFHDLRHTTGTRLGELGVDPFTIANVLGHSDLRMTARYTHATDRAKREAVDALAKYDVTILSQ